MRIVVKGSPPSIGPQAPGMPSIHGILPTIVDAEIYDDCGTPITGVVGPIDIHISGDPNEPIVATLRCLVTSLDIECEEKP
jgi:hypothetical protein